MIEYEEDYEDLEDGTPNHHFVQFERVTGKVNTPIELLEILAKNSTHGLSIRNFKFIEKAQESQNENRNRI